MPSTQRALGPRVVEGGMRGEPRPTFRLWTEPCRGESIVWTVRFMADITKITAGTSAPLFIAALKGHTAALELLLAAKAGVDAPKQNGCTPLWIAAEKGHLDVVRLLLLGGDVTGPVRRGRRRCEPGGLPERVVGDEVGLRAGVERGLARGRGVARLGQGAGVAGATRRVPAGDDERRLIARPGEGCLHVAEAHPGPLGAAPWVAPSQPPWDLAQHGFLSWGPAGPLFRQWPL